MPQQSEWPLPPFVQLRDFLPPAEHQALLQWVLCSEDKFHPAKIINDGPRAKSLVDPEFRIGLTNRDLGSLGPTLERRLREALPALEAATGSKSDCSSIELELAAHGDGAHYKAHLDISYGEGRKTVGAKAGEDRVLSAVYYFYREPKGFAGGALRIYRFNARPKSGPVHLNDFVDVDPLQNSLVAFPSWAMHEVRPVTCPSEAFRDYRFALNCWFCRRL